MSFDVDHLRASVSNHVTARNLGWCNRPVPLYAGGPLLSPLTIEKHLWLLWVENPILCGSANEQNVDEAVLQLLYICSPSCKPFSRWRRKLWQWRNRKKINLEVAKVAITQWLDAQFVNSPNYAYRNPAVKPKQSDSVDDPSLFDEVKAIIRPLESNHFAAYYARLFHAHYGWDQAKTFRTPYPQIHMHEWQIISDLQSGQQVKTYPKDTYMNAYLESKA
jgi:hypothetical protein